MNLKRKIDYAEFGGAPLLGVNGITMICHGRSSAKAIKNAIRRAKGMAEGGVTRADSARYRRESRHDHARGEGPQTHEKPYRQGPVRIRRARVLTNAELERMVATSDEWITRTDRHPRTAYRSYRRSLLGSCGSGPGKRALTAAGLARNRSRS